MMQASSGEAVSVFYHALGHKMTNSGPKKSVSMTGFGHF